MSVKSPARSEYTLHITRIFDAPRALVFKAWTDPAMVARWMGPRSHPAVAYRNELRVGGAWSGVLRPVAGGPDLPQGGVYREIVPNRKLVMTFAWDEAHPAHGADMLVTIELFDHGEGQTRMEFTHERLPSAAERDGHNGGWNSTFDRLEELLRAA
jgi:uncharacterized protein YndB with AHSA1/START domain